MHYFQIPRRHWSRCLDAVVDLGLPLVESYVPWAVHERSLGTYDFVGGVHRDRFERGLQDFLSACDERGLKVLLRPGPHVNGELNFFGFPERILRDERCLARGTAGNPVILPAPPRCFPVPSYASEVFLAQAEQYLEAVGGFVAPLQWPAGPVVGMQVDNELSFFFRTAAYDQDYHEDAIALYRRFLAERHPDGLPAGYGQGAVATMDPPRRFDLSGSGSAAAPATLVPHLEWVAFKEHLLLLALSRLAAALRRGGCDRLLLFHNLPASDLGTPFSIPAAEEQVDFLGFDFYQRLHEYPTVKRQALLLAGCSRLPVSPELGCGGWPFWFPLDAQEQRRNALAALMHGIKGFNLYMAVERDRWYGAPIAPDGARRRPIFDEVRRLVRTVQETDLPALQQEIQVALLQVRDYQRLGLCTALTDPLPPMGLSLLGLDQDELCSDESCGLTGPVAREYSHTWREAEAALACLHVPYHILDAEVPPTLLQRYRLLVVPCFDFLACTVIERLHGFVQAGGTLIVTPRVPLYDALMEPLTAPLPEHLLAEKGALEPLLAETLKRLHLMPVLQVDAPQVDLALFTEGPQRTPQLLFVANRSPEPQTVCIQGIPSAAPRPGEEHTSQENAPGAESTAERQAWDALDGRPVELSAVQLAPLAVRMLRLQRQVVREDTPGDDS